MSDIQVRSLAASEDRIIITKDNDFWDYFFKNGVPPRVLLLRLGNISNRELRSILESHFNQITADFKRGANLILLDRNYIYCY